MNRVPKIRFKESSGEWVEKKLGEISSNIMYGMNTAAKEFDGCNKYIRITDISESNNKFIPNPLSSPCGIIEDKFLVNENDILFTRTGASTGKSYLYNHNDGKIFFAGFLIRYNILPENSSKFVFYQTLREKYRNWLKIMSMRSGQPGINAEEYKEFKFKSPLLPEQEKIADFLSSVDIKIEKLERKKELWEEYKKGMMQKIFSQEIRLSPKGTPSLHSQRSDGNGKEYPQWEEKKLGEICNIATGKLDANAMIENGKYRFYTCAKDFYYIDNYAFDTDALLISGNGANVGYIHHYNGKFNAYQRTYVLDQFEEKIIFIKYSLEKYLKKRIDAEKNEGNTPYIVLGTLKDMKILLPSIEEQEKIAGLLSSIDSKIEITEKELEGMKEFKKGLLQGMFV